MCKISAGWPEGAGPVQLPRCCYCKAAPATHVLKVDAFPEHHVCARCAENWLRPDAIASNGRPHHLTELTV